MSDSSSVIIHTDGASRGNPGAAAYAYVIERPGHPTIEEADCLGHMTNNQAEYTALLRALEHALELSLSQRVVVHSDSELMVKQLNGEYRVKNEELRPLFEQIQDLRREFPSGVQIRHVRRGQNQRADALCNEALDGLRRSNRRKGTPVPAGDTQRVSVAVKPAPANGLRDKALACLHAAAEAWTEGAAVDPTPEDVWRQLAGILREHGFVADGH